MLAEGATLAALMEEKDIVRRESAPGSPVAGTSDLLWRMELLESGATSTQLQHARLCGPAMRCSHCANGPIEKCHAGG